MRGESVDIPRYDFITGRRTWHKNPLTLDERSILIVEGIHGLNPRLTPSVPEAQKFRIYISCFTSVAMDNLSRIATTDNRLLRRLTRDYTQRGADAVATLSRWGSVRRGEEKHIFPYQENADVMLNSSLFYEISVLRPYAEKDPPRGSRHGTRVRRGAAHAEVPEKLHPHPARRDPAHVYHPGVHRRQQFQVLTPASPAGQTPSPAAPRVSAATPRFAACGCQRGRLRPTEAYPCATGKI